MQDGGLDAGAGVEHLAPGVDRDRLEQAGLRERIAGALALAASRPCTNPVWISRKMEENYRSTHDACVYTLPSESASGAPTSSMLAASLCDAAPAETTVNIWSRAGRLNQLFLINKHASSRRLKIGVFRGRSPQVAPKRISGNSASLQPGTAAQCDECRLLRKDFSCANQSE